MELHVLIVEDEPEVREWLEAALSMAGHRVTTVGDGGAAWTACQRETFDLVVTDLLMPESDGIELLLKLRKAQPDLKAIAMSGGGRVTPSDYLDLAKRCGAVRTLVKPFSMADLQEAIAAAVGSAGRSDGAAEARGGRSQESEVRSQEAED